MRMKKAQISSFIIIGILIVFSIGLILYTSPKQQPVITEVTVQKPGILAEQQLGIQGFIQSCIRDAARRGIYTAALHGGYLYPSGLAEYGEPGDNRPSYAHYYLESISLPYLIDSKSAKIRSLDVIKTLVEHYVLVELDKCANFSAFKQGGFKVFQPDIDWQEIEFDYAKAIVNYSDKNVNSEVIFGKQDTTVLVSYPVVLQSGDQRIEVSDFMVKLPLRFRTLHSIAKELLSAITKEQPYNIKDDCSRYRTADNLVNLYFVPNAFQKSYAIRIIDALPAAHYGDLPLRFQFAMKNVEVSGECAG